MELEQIREQLVNQLNESTERTIMLRGAVEGINVAIRERDNPTPVEESTTETTEE